MSMGTEICARMMLQLDNAQISRRLGVLRHKESRQLMALDIQIAWKLCLPCCYEPTWRLISLSLSLPPPSEKSQMTLQRRSLRTKRLARSLLGTSVPRDQHSTRQKI